MFYEKELVFLRDTLKKIHINVEKFSPKDENLDDNTDLRRVLGYHIFDELWKSAEDRTLYKVTDAFKRCYMYFRLPETDANSILIIGPYFTRELNKNELLELAETNGIQPKDQKYFNEYILSVPMVDDKDRILNMIDTFCETIWKSPSFSIVDKNTESKALEFSITEVSQNEGQDDPIVNVKALEKRYDFENELIRAVSLGQLHKEKLFASAFTTDVFEKRTSDSLRNAKNYAVIMNTLLRKAAESGGVHPIYLDRVSSDFAQKIELFSSQTAVINLMKEMFVSYCRLVRKHSMKDFSLVVQKTILLIDSNLSADLSTSALAKKQNVSSGYLSTIFKKETGKTLSEYVREKRVKLAAKLLDTTNLQVQTVALHCGIVDIQYFSKIFKKHMGVSPKEYKNSKK